MQLSFQLERDASILQAYTSLPPELPPPQNPSMPEQLPSPSQPTQPTSLQATPDTFAHNRSQPGPSYTVQLSDSSSDDGSDRELLELKATLPESERRRRIEIRRGKDVN